MKQGMIIGAVFTLMLVSASAAEPLDNAIKQIGSHLNERIPKGDKIAFVSAGADFPNLVGYIIDGLVERAVNDRLFSVVDRAQLDAIRAEQLFQASGDVDDATMQSMGRILGVKVIVTVKAAQYGDMFRLSVRALGVESAQILAAPPGQTIPSGPLVLALTKTRRAPEASASVSPPAHTAPVAAQTPGRAVAPGTAPAPAVSAEAAPADVEQRLLTTGTLVLDGVYSTSGKADIQRNSLPYLTSIAKMLVKHPQLRVEIGGHTDNIGNPNTNIRLSEQRAEAVLQYLVSVEPKLTQMLTAKGYGSTVPMADNRTAAGRATNRRIELKIINR